MPGRHHSREFKLEVVSQINTGQRSTAQLSREHALAPRLIHRWRKDVEAWLMPANTSTILSGCCTTASASIPASATSHPPNSPPAIITPRSDLPTGTVDWVHSTTVHKRNGSFRSELVVTGETSCTIADNSFRGGGKADSECGSSSLRRVYVNLPAKVPGNDVMNN